MLRRYFLTTFFATTLAFPTFSATMGDDGLHKADWQHDTFRDMREDLATANEEGKTLLIMFEQRGCIYCTKMHEDVLPDPEITELLTDRFYVVQYNLFGDTKVTDFDGEELSEKDAAMKWGVMFTPTLMFFPSDVPEGVSAKEAAVVNMPGAFGKWTMRNILTWVDEKGYESDENFQKYHARKIEDARAAGTEIDDD